MPSLIVQGESAVENRVNSIFYIICRMRLVEP